MQRRRDRAAPLRLPALLAALIGLAGCGMAEQRADDPFSASGELIALSGGVSEARNACFTCHGLDGAGNGAGAPRLAGLDAGYLDRQLNGYASGRRQHPEMEAIARRLGGRDRLAVATYYSQMPFATQGTAAPMAAPPLYGQGDPARGLPSCATCHGERGEGVGPGNPALAGQSAAYLAHQMHQWRDGKRRTDPMNVMLRISQLLTPAEISALASYAAALPGAPPRLEFRESSLPERRDDPKNGASAPPRRGVAQAR